MAYVAAQVIGAVAGVFVAHAMFAELILQVSTTLRQGPGQAFSELVATFGLVLAILVTRRLRPGFTPMAVGLYIAAAYWFTASTSFANPAVTVARSLSDTFAGIAPDSAPAFIAAQLLGAAAPAVIANWLLSTGRTVLRPRVVGRRRWEMRGGASRPSSDACCVTPSTKFSDRRRPEAS